VPRTKIRIGSMPSGLQLSYFSASGDVVSSARQHLVMDSCLFHDTGSRAASSNIGAEPRQLDLSAKDLSRALHAD
jgi:hypothetical protein